MEQRAFQDLFTDEECVRGEVVAVRYTPKPE